MRFNEIYAGAKGPIISFEVFPPKTEQSEARLDAALPRLRALRPRFMTCTYGAGGSTRDKTLGIAARIKNELGLDAACHLTCVGSSRAELREMVGRITSAGLDNIVALRGDPPQGEKEFEPAPDGLRYGNELVELIRGMPGGDGIGIAVAGYPEKHLEAPDKATDMVNLKRKVGAGADVVITQLFFDNDEFFSFRDEARRQRLGVPIVPGLMPIQSAKQIQRMAAMCGASIPGELRRRLEMTSDDLAATRRLGTEYCLEQAQGLLKQGVPGLHFYVLNQAEQMEAVVSGLGLQAAPASS